MGIDLFQVRLLAAEICDQVSSHWCDYEVEQVSVRFSVGTRRIDLRGRRWETIGVTSKEYLEFLQTLNEATRQLAINILARTLIREILRRKLQLPTSPEFR